ncbi:hypothetical protein A2872_01015 [Candidatus Gottesmanbacteria bacterium RIFCSPHIGHO2_01_FULL_42_12]|uniref:Uncharacterized protein n=1 Tax=Candidatus Gottesmanbacteria bacterium RIFCSPHIGHO2_01_FULL_42_12 TaxID=1798377 RepID=A0A1F5Z346_9BACT|nr:MAG: hypothetical protein A2872_01015 [Candidatus Gottesmanbacteria bacterium RIFCSPHIGHO2_01_FULL_42_12]
MAKKRKKNETNKVNRSRNLSRGQLVIAGIFIAVILFLIFSIFILKDLPSPNSLANPVQSTKIYDRNGKLLYSVFTSENRTYIPIGDIPQALQKATIASEDKDFYRHGGINFVGGILRAARDMIFYRNVQGGSTLTQQLVKSALLSPERTLPRKIKEIVLAFWTERIYPKDKILEMYLNQIPYGGTAYGAEEAARIYFGKHAKDLSLAESALLAGITPAPTYYSPLGTDPSRAKKRQVEVLNLMAENGFISKDEADKSAAEPLTFNTQRDPILAPHFVMLVKEQLVKKYGEQMVDWGGLKVTTTLDFDLQSFAQITVASETARQKNLKVGNGAALVTNPGTGEILAMIGSRDYFSTESGSVNVVFANRSPGSAIKPLNYALGFLKGLVTPATAWIDGRYCFPPFNGKSYCPQNYDGKFHGVVQTRFALGNSLNIPAVKILAINKVEDFIATASAMGLRTLDEDPNRYGYSLTLGGGETTMADLSTAFGVFANGGRRQDLLPILKVEDGNGKILEDNSTKPQVLNSRFQKSWDGSQPYIPYDDWVLPSEVTFLVSHILLDDSSRTMTFGAGSVLNIPGKVVSVKTGTTEDKRDNWTIGYTPSRLTAVWVGNNDNSAMSPSLESGNTGAAPIWNKIMKYTLKDLSPEWPQKPENVIFMEVCALSGLLPDHGCPVRGEYFIKGFLPREKDTVWEQKRKIWVFKDTHKPATGNFQPDQVQEEDHLVISDPFQKDFCVDCPL